MTKNQLAKALRARQLRAGLVSKADVLATPPDALVSSYANCSRCLMPLFDDVQKVVSAASTCSDFVLACEAALSAHQCPAKKAVKN